MSNRGLFNDTTPIIRPAGITTAIQGDRTEVCIRPNLYNERVETPSDIKKYRKLTRETPGIKQLHHGIYNDPKDHENIIHGVKTADSDHVNDCIKGSNLIGVNYFLNEIKENKYSRLQREPLGKSIIRNYEFPEKIKEDNNFRFGLPNSGFINTKELIYSGTCLNETEDVKKLYSRTHGLSEPGEQKDRNYSWKVDKTNFVFGRPDNIEIDGAKKSLRIEFLDSTYPKTKIIDKRLEDYRQATVDVVGRGKFRGMMNVNLDENHVFGKKSIVGENWNVGKCISGDPDEKKEEHYNPDPDLGKNVLYRSKLSSLKPRNVNSGRIFGVPSVREDLKKTFVSINDNTNYGGEKDAFELLYPNPHNTRGLDDPDFEQCIRKDQLIEILQKNKYNIPEEEFNIIYEIALKNYPNYDNLVSFKAFIEVMRNLKREFMKYRTLIK